MWIFSGHNKLYSSKDSGFRHNEGAFQPVASRHFVKKCLFLPIETAFYAKITHRGTEFQKTAQPKHVVCGYFYHALVHLLFRYLGLFIDSEVQTSDGRMDAVVQTADRVFIVEFKLRDSAAAAQSTLQSPPAILCRPRQSGWTAN
jgi:PD-(D/E)XK nuclease superfamily